MDRTNPFSAQAIRPGGIAFHFEQSANPQKLVERFQIQYANRAAIVGPHGSGKSTLLAAMGPDLKKKFRSVTTIRLRRLDVSKRFAVAWASGGLLIVDGFEQWRFWERLVTVEVARLRRRPLLVTTHRRIAGLPVLYETSVNRAMIAKVVSWLLRDEPHMIPQYTLICEDRWPEFQGNLRELLFALYDCYEDQRVLRVRRN